MALLTQTILLASFAVTHKLFVQVRQLQVGNWPGEPQLLARPSIGDAAGLGALGNANALKILVQQMNFSNVGNLVASQGRNESPTAARRMLVVHLQGGQFLAGGAAGAFHRLVSAIQQALIFRRRLFRLGHDLHVHSSRDGWRSVEWMEAAK